MVETLSLQSIGNFVNIRYRKMGMGSDAFASDEFSVRFLFFFLYRRRLHTTPFRTIGSDCSQNNAKPGTLKSQKIEKIEQIFLN
jgi:hypothetical protein